MKKVLLATTALVSAGMLAGAGEVAAQDKPISLSLGGYYRTAFAVGDDDNNSTERGAGTRNHQISQDVEVHFKGETTLSRGITAGAVIELEAQEQAGDQIDEAWGYLKGRWGEVRFGDEDPVHRLAALAAPNAADNFGVNSPFFFFSNNGATLSGTTGPGTNSTSLPLANDATKILYFTPRISGFQASVSYAPDGSQDIRTLARGGRLKTDGGLSQAWSVAGTYDGKLGPVDLKAMLGYGRAQNETAGTTVATGIVNDDPSTVLAGLNVGFSGWWIGGSYQNIDDRGGLRGREADVFDVGVAYLPGPWGVSLGWSRGKYKVNGATTAATATTAASTAVVEDTLNHYVLGGQYTLGPGVRMSAALEYMKYDPGLAGVATYDSKALMIGTTFAF